jgi:hypothetical protein
MKPIAGMKEANSVLARKGKYKNLTEEQSKKILKDTEDHIFERDIPIDPEDMADGGVAGLLGERTGFRFGGNPHEATQGSAGAGQTSGGHHGGGNGGGNRPNPHTVSGYSKTSTPTRTIAPPGEKGGQGYVAPHTPPVTTGGGSGPPSVLNPQPFNYGKFRKNTAKNTLWSKWQKHVMMSNLMKEGKLKDYHQLGAHDFTQRFEVPNWLSKGLATTYQYGSELGRQFIPVNKNNIYTAISKNLKKDTPFEPLGAAIGSISNALSRAKEESRLGHKGIEGLTEPQQEIYNQYAKQWNPVLNTMYKADGGPARQNFGLGGMGRRAFLKWMAGTGAGIGAVKSGLFSLLKGGGKKKVVEEVVKQSAGSGTPPAYFFNLVRKIKNLGDDVTETASTAPHQKVHKYQDYELTENVSTGYVEINKKGVDIAEDVYMSHTPGEVISQGTKKGKKKVIKSADEYEEFTATPDAEGKMKDISQGVPDEVMQEGTVFEDTIAEFTKKASGGRVPLSAGGLAGMLGE